MSYNGESNPNRHLPLLRVPYIEELTEKFFKDGLHRPVSKEEFVQPAAEWLLGQKRNTITGYESFEHIDIINGVTHFIDNIVMKYGLQNIQIFEHDYTYHQRLNPDIKFATVDTLQPEKPLIISMPFSGECDVHLDMTQILDRCLELKIPVFIDGAWLGVAKDITFDLSHPAIHSFAISFSKGLNLGWNRIGLRWSRHQDETDSIAIHNKFGLYNIGALPVILYLMEYINPDYFWDTYEQAYNEVCRKNLVKPTKIIFIAKRFDDKPWFGTAPGITELTTRK